MSADTQYAEIEWLNGVPFSPMFNDFYCSCESGQEESKYVFIEHSQFIDKIKSLKENSHFTIAEAGFGAASNFLTTLIKWKEIAPPNTSLHYISIEKYPLKPQDLKQILQLFPELYANAHELLAQYYLLTKGYHRITLSKNVFLTLIIDDVNNALTQLNTNVDIWYLDGFSPSKNEAMWNDYTIKQIAKLSSINTTFSTYAANSNLFRTLIANGFHVIKAKGFGKKREMLHGYLIQKSESKAKINKPYLALNQTSHNNVQNIAVIGGGISGATTAYALAKRGYNVTIFERNSSLAQEASGNNQGVIYGNFSIHDKYLFELSSNSYRLTNHLINLLDPDNNYHQQCGVIQLSHNSQQHKRNLELINHINDQDFVRYVNNAKIEEISGCKPKFADGIYFPHGMWINPVQFIQSLVQQHSITIKTSTNITKLEYIKSQWVLSIENNPISENFDAVVLCNSFILNQFEQTAQLPVRKIRGQVSTSSSTSPVDCVVCGEGYITPNYQNNFSFGATFDFENENFNVTQEEHLQNITTIESMIEINKPIDLASLSGKTNIRVSTNDYLPIIGPVSARDWFMTEYARLSLDKNYFFKNKVEYIPNLFINCGYGSKGLLFASLGGEIIANYIENTQLPISEELRQAIHPNRLYARELIKKVVSK